MSNHPTESFPSPSRRSGDGQRLPSAPDFAGEPIRPSTDSHPGDEHDTKSVTDAADAVSSQDGSHEGSGGSLDGSPWRAASDSSIPPPVRDDLANAGGEPPKSPRPNHDATHDDPIPREIGRYTIQRVLGSGAFGRVYLAWDNLMHRDVALKVPKRGVLPPGEQTQRFLDEARAAANLKHPAIVRIYDVARTDDDRAMLVMEYIAGATLFDQMAKRRFTVQEACRLISAAANALAYAHQHGVFHRDIKPGNILVDEHGEPHIADFGLAVVAEKQWHSPAGKAGTAPYMSPEQVQGDNKQVDGRADIWALGVVLYELLTGQKPFRGKTPSALFHDILHGVPQPPRQRNPDVPNEIDRACRKCLAKSPDERFTAAQDLADELMKGLAHAFATGSSAERPQSHSSDSPPIPSTPPVKPPVASSRSESKPPVSPPPLAGAIDTPVIASNPGLAAEGSSAVGGFASNSPKPAARSSFLGAFWRGTPALLVVLFGIALIVFSVIARSRNRSNLENADGRSPSRESPEKETQVAIDASGVASHRTSGGHSDRSSDELSAMNRTPSANEIADGVGSSGMSGAAASELNDSSNRPLASPSNDARGDEASDGGSQTTSSAVAGRAELMAELDVLVWDPVNSARRNVSVSQPGVSPLRVGDNVRVAVRTSRLLHVYLIWIDSLGVATPVFPWSQPKWDAPIENDAPVTELSLPTDGDVFWPLEGRPGMETLVLLARETPMPADAEAESWFAGLPVQTKMQDDRALVWFSQGRPIAAGSQVRGPKFFDPKRVDDPALSMQQTLADRVGGHFSLFQAVSFAKIQREETAPAVRPGE